MDDRTNREVPDRRSQTVLVRDVPFNQRSPAHGPTMSVHDIVKRNRKISSSSERFASMASDVACAAGHEYGSELVRSLVCETYHALVYASCASDVSPQNAIEI